MTLRNENIQKNLRRRLKRVAKDACSIKTAKKRLPITRWLPTYNFTILIQDMIAGITVGLTAIPQGIAYAVVAGLSPEYGLYSGLMGGFVYLFFGSSKDVTVGPTAIMSALTARYVLDYSSDFAVLAAFLSGVVILIMGTLQLGFLVDFVSVPVISGFTTAAALQIASAQFTSLFGLDGKSGTVFSQSVYNFVVNIRTAKLWDPVLGFSTILILVLLKKFGEGCSRNDTAVRQFRWLLSLARNAVVVVIGMIIVYVIKVVQDQEPLKLIGDIGSGLPKFQLPPFSTVVGNETYDFSDMMETLGPQSIVIPLVSIIESIAIAKAFAGGAQLDATQEMIALGFCNVIGSFVRSMPVTGSFTRTALNNASGVQTPAGGIFTGFLILLALSLLTSTFYFIPKASLAGLIITAMFSMIDYEIFMRLWKNSKRELLVMFVTILVSLWFGLEYGLVIGILAEAVMLLFRVARPKIEISSLKTADREAFAIPLGDNVAYCAAEHIRRAVLEAAQVAGDDAVIIVDGSKLRSMDMTVAANLMAVVKDLERKSRKIVFLNFNPEIQKICESINNKHADKFINAPSAEDLGMLNERKFSAVNVNV
ncbi:Sodium-independent sulfate anion transporter [Eumeta japonica]|uniref:Sodium-independent sulfate anion transporter n=1 Tax=Eumeta variegata TaxID=151549 RepID=A0A4C1YRF3_EUMVA|nr:Sodium-independent sulfate anion transporter [Eumeta japonica]